MKMMKQMACAAFAAALVAGMSGCGGSKDYSSPKVAEGTIAAIAARPAENTSLAALCKQHGLVSSELVKQAPDKEFQDIVKELELDKAQHKWAIVSISDLSADKIEKGEPDFAVAIATTVDLDKVVAVAQAKNKNEKIEKATIADVPAYTIFKGDKPEGYMANLDKQLILVANSSAGLEKQIALYRDGKGASADFGSFTLGANDILRIKVAKVGENVKKSLPSPDALQMVNGFVPDGDKIILGMGAVELAVGAADANIKLDLTLETAADADADKLVTLAKTGLMPLTAQMQKAAEKDAEAKTAYDVLKGITLEAKGKVATLAAVAPAEPIFKLLAEKAKALK